jgi:ribonuclease HI
MLGAWIGNQTKDDAPWETIIDKINSNLERWKHLHPTLNGRKLIIQVVVGGHTQFLANAQGMPKHIENALKRIIKSFMWDDDSSPRITCNTLCHPIHEGGLGLLDITARNEAIDIIWLKKYLNFSLTCPIWAAITDIIIQELAPRWIVDEIEYHPFLQCWNIPTPGPANTNISNDIKRMLRIAKKYKTNLAAICLTPHLNTQLPTWYHLATETRLMLGMATKCLIKKHKATIVADLLRTSTRVRNAETEHRPSPYCQCQDCELDKQKDCLNPHACATEASIRLQLIAPKLNPLARPPSNDNLSLTATRKTNNETARRTNQDITFNPTITSRTNLTECFRIFTDPGRISNSPATRHHTQPQEMGLPPITMYTNGACFNNGKEDARSGSGIWFGQNDSRNTALKVPGKAQSNQIGEICTVIIAAEKVLRYQPMIIVTDSKYVINGLTTHLDEWENKGWTEVKNKIFFKRAAYLLRKRSATTTFRWVKGHNGNPENEQSNALAKQGVMKNSNNVLNLNIPKEFDLQGVRLISLTQATAYRGIKEREPLTNRESTKRNITLTIEAIQNYTGSKETEAAIWQGLR